MTTKLKNLGSKFKRPASLDARKARAGYIFTLPFILGIVLIYVPILIDSIWFSFSDMTTVFEDGVAKQVYNLVGLEYYKYAFVSSPDFLTTLLEGLQQLILEVPAIVIFSLFIAVILNSNMLGRATFRAIFFVPVIIATGLMDTINAQDISSSQTGEGIDDGSGGGQNQIISMLDVEQLFMSMKIGGEIVGYVVGLVNSVYQIINYSGVQMLIFLAGLQSISPQIYEACRIDGATGWETFWKITFPMISPMILVNGVYTIIDSFTRSTNVMMSYISEVYVAEAERATAYSWIYFVVVVLILAVVGALASSFVFYQRRD